MEIAPLIHSRTFYCDFSQNFAARPNDLNVHWAMNKILPAMRDVDILNGVRRMFATDGKTCIAGVACNFRYFVENYLSADERAEAANYLHDERGRELKIFLGYVFKDSGVPDVSESMLWQMFKQTVAKVWNNNPSDTVIVPYESCGVKSVAKRTLDKKFYPSNERDDIELFEQCIAARKDFCSNVDAVKIFEDGKYEVITAAQSVINRIQEAQAQKQEAQKKTQPTASSNRAQATGQQPFQAQHSQSPKPSARDEKTTSIPLIIGIAIAVIVVLVVIFLVLS